MVSQNGFKQTAVVCGRREAVVRQVFKKAHRQARKTGAGRPGPRALRRRIRPRRLGKRRQGRPLAVKVGSRGAGDAAVASHHKTLVHGKPEFGGDILKLHADAAGRIVIQQGLYALVTAFKAKTPQAAEGRGGFGVALKNLRQGCLPGLIQSVARSEPR